MGRCGSYILYIYLCARMIIFILCCSTRTCNTWHNPIPFSNNSLSLSLYLSLYFFLIFVLVHLLTPFLFLSSSFYVAFSSFFLPFNISSVSILFPRTASGDFRVCCLFKNHIPLRSWFLYYVFFIFLITEILRAFDSSPVWVSKRRQPSCQCHVKLFFLSSETLTKTYLQ